MASVVRDGAAWNTGLSATDEVLLINGAAPSDETVKALIGGPVGTEVKLQVRRDGLPRDITLKTLPNPDRKFTIQPMAAPPPPSRKCWPSGWGSSWSKSLRFSGYISGLYCQKKSPVRVARGIFLSAVVHEIREIRLNPR